MKKLLALILVVCAVFAVGISYLNFTDRDEVITQYEQAMSVPVAEEVPVAQDVPVEPSPEPVEYKGIDTEAIYALHAPEDVVMTMGGSDVNWEEYFCSLSNQILQVDEIFTMMAAYGQEGKWSDVADPNNGMNYLEVVNYNAEAMLRELYAVENMSVELGVELSEEDSATVEAQIEATKQGLCGEGADEEAFAAALREKGITVDFLRRIIAVDLLYAGNHDAIYGADGELVDEADVSAWLAEQGYMRANHILFMSIDQATGEALEQSVIDEKLAQAQAIIAEISAIEDPEERKTRFEELKAEYCEDSGKVAYPEGYTFTSGTMVKEFEEATLALEDYAISEPVESKYGYHVLLRLPLEAEAMISSSNGSAATGAQLYIANDYQKTVQDAMDSVEVVYAEGFEPINIPEYMKNMAQCQ